ncbi:MAG TPA: glycosyltransferase family 2 protein [Acidimicrobiia bacterium]
MPAVPEVSVVVPVYREAESIAPFLEHLLPVLEEHTTGHEVIFAVDPGPDDTEEAIRKARAEHPSVKLLVFSRRFGQPTATLAGIEYASGRSVVVMDVDLQDPPELVPEMLDRWREGAEVVYARRRKRAGETRVKKAISQIGYRVIDRFSEVPIPRDTGDFRLMDRRVVDALMRFPETHGFLRGMVALVGFRQESVVFDRPPRHAGRGNYNRFFGSVRIGLNGLVAFSTALLSIATMVGFVAAVAAFVLAIAYIVAQVIDEPFPVGNPTIVGLVLFVGGIQLISLGIIGQYIGRIYDEVKRRPRYIVDVAEGFVGRDAPVHGYSGR